MDIDNRSSFLVIRRNNIGDLVCTAPLVAYATLELMELAAEHRGGDRGRALCANLCRDLGHLLGGRLRFGAQPQADADPWASSRVGPSTGRRASLCACQGCALFTARGARINGFNAGRLSSAKNRCP